MAVEPPAALVAKPDPFDRSNEQLWYWDASLYSGHYYLYWGPVPALLLAAFKTLARVIGQLGDQYVVFALASLQLVAGALLIYRVWRLIFSDIPPALMILAVLAFGFVNPTLYNLARGGVYESAIFGGHAFLITGLLFAFEDIRHATATGATSWKLAAAGTCWALALGCRVSIAPGVLLLVLLTIFVGSRRAQWWRSKMVAAAWLAGPVVIGVGALLVYNRARFDAWFDFGRHYQLTWIPLRTSWTFVPANIYSYSLRPFVLRCKFPFLFAIPEMAIAAFPDWFTPPEGYVVWEQIAGFLNTVPLSWVAPIAVFFAGLSAYRFIRPGQDRQDARSVTIAWLSASTAIAATMTMVALMTLSNGTMRYLGDGAGALALTGTIGAWILYCRFRPHTAMRRAITVIYVALVVATVGMGIAFGFEGQAQHFRQNNPVLLDKLEARLSLCHP
jgi:hypothetical protein